MSFAFYGISCSTPQGLGFNLRKTVARYSAVSLPQAYMNKNCQSKRSDSFSRHSAASRGGMEATWALTRVSELPDKGWGSRDPLCRDYETPISCELRLLRPRYMFVMTGSNDPAWKNHLASAPARLRAIIRVIKRFRTIPVLLTIPPNTGDYRDPTTGLHLKKWVPAYNRRVKMVARTEKIPLIDLWSVLNKPRIVNKGVREDDGVHLNVYSPENSDKLSSEETMAQSVIFNSQSLRYGANRRNYLMIRALKIMDNQWNRIKARK